MGIPGDTPGYEEEGLTKEYHTLGYTYMGPGTNFEKRVKGTFQQAMPVNDLDYFTMRHDMFYQLKDPLARIYSDELLLQDLQNRMFKKVPWTQRILMMATWSIFTIKNKLEREGGKRGEFGWATHDLQGDPAYLANDILQDKFQKIEKKWKQFKTLMDDAGFSFTGSGGQLRQREGSIGLKEEHKEMYKEFISDTDFLFKHPPPRDLKTNFTEEEKTKTKIFLEKILNNFQGDRKKNTSR